jgi:hypothetical protein
VRKSTKCRSAQHVSAPGGITRRVEKVAKKLPEASTLFHKLQSTIGGSGKRPGETTLKANSIQGHLCQLFKRRQLPRALWELAILQQRLANLRLLLAALA